MQRKIIYYIIAVVVIVALVLVANNRAKKQVPEKSDYYVFWKAGKDYSSNSGLYAPGNIRPYIYPPFAAFTFQVLTLLPFKISAFIFFLINVLVLLPVSVVLLFRISANIGWDKSKIMWPIILATLCSLKFFWNNLINFQVNFLVFFICLSGVFYLSKKKPHIAAVLFVIGTFIKVYPVFLCVYVLGYYRTTKVIAAVLVTGLLCLLIPGLQRGFTQSYEDHLTYKEVFLDEFKEGTVYTSYKNHSLKSFVLKAFHPETRDQKTEPGKYATALLSANIFLLIMLGTIVANAIYQYKNRITISLFLLSCIFIFSHLISGITWTAHLVSSMLFYFPLFLIDRKQLNVLAKPVYWFLMVAVFFSAIEGSDTTGKTIYYFIRNYDFFVIIMLMLFFFYTYIIISGKEKLVLEASRPLNLNFKL